MSRRGELQVGACFLGFGLGIWGATIAGGAQDMCILYLPAVFMGCIYHYSQGGTKNVMVNLFFMMPAGYFGLVHKTSSRPEAMIDGGRRWFRALRHGATDSFLFGSSPIIRPVRLST